MSEAPPNQFYDFFYSLPVSGGHAEMKIRAPGGRVEPKDVETLTRWFALIVEQLQDAAVPESVDLTQQPTPAAAGREARYMSTETETTVTPRRTLVETQVVIEPGYVPFWDRRSEESKMRFLEEWAKELTAFFRDHRGMDVNAIRVEPTYQMQCSGCSREWEEIIDDETGKACCASCGVPVEVVR